MNVNGNGPRITTIASGKGGVGKTNLALNLALLLANASAPSFLMDADVGMANVDVLLGLSPDRSLTDFFHQRCSFKEIILQGPGNLRILPGGSALGEIPDPGGIENAQLSEIVGSMKGCHDLVIDASAGLSPQVLHFMESADIPVVVIIPEPTSLTDAYSLLKSLHKRGCPGPFEIVVNQAKSERHAEHVYRQFSAAVHKFIDIPLEYLGHVVKDPKVVEAVRTQTPFTILFPESDPTRCVKGIARKIQAVEPANGNKKSLKTLFRLPDPGGLPVTGEVSEPPPAARDGGAGTDAGEIVDLLVEEGRITATQLDYARRVNAKLDSPKRLLILLKELGYATEGMIKDTLSKHRAKLRLGSLLVELGYINEKQLSMALHQQGQTGHQKRLGELLVECNYISQYDLTQALSMSLGYPYIEVGLKSIDRGLMKKASPQFFLENRFVPLGHANDRVQVATSDPLNKGFCEAVKRLFGDKVDIHITMDNLVVQTLNAYEHLEEKKQQEDLNKNEIVALVDKIIRDAIDNSASDIHIEPFSNNIRIRLRKDGTLIHYDDLPKEYGPAVVSRLKVLASANIAEKRRHQDGRILMGSAESGEEIDIRVSFYVTLFGEKVVCRILTKKAELFRIRDLGMSPRMLDRFKDEVLDVPTGVIIVTGPTGAGKTTTLYAAINYCNNVETNIVTAEEPVEYVIEGISQCSINPKIGVTFEETLRHMMRQDPDIIILGEIRDRFSAESSIQAALTGHKVLTTFHTEDTIGGLLRLMNMDIEAFLISSTVVSVVAQRLLKKVCPYCGKDYVPNAKELRRLQYSPQSVRNAAFKVGTGCSHCDFTGYKGRVGVFELLVLNEYVKDAILNRKTSYEIRRISIETTGLVTLLEDGIAKAARGVTSIQEVIKKLPLLEPPRPLDLIHKLTGEA